MERPIAKKMLSAIRREGRRGMDDLARLLSGGASDDATLAGLHPAHAAYVRAQHAVSAVSERITSLSALAPFAKVVSAAEDEYVPSGPPMSPLTGSFFTCWAFFDVAFGATDETIGTCILQLRGDPALLAVIELLQSSRMGVHLCEGSKGGLVSLRELVTGTTCRAVVPAGHVGRAGELWYARVLPPPAAGLEEHVVFTTPYVLREPGLQAWEAYFDRAVPAGTAAQRAGSHHRHLKFGPTRSYWNEFVFEGYVGHSAGAVFLAGLPDVAKSRPHSRVTSGR